jgi:hypothetical protein
VRRLPPGSASSMHPAAFQRDGRRKPLNTDCSRRSDPRTVRRHVALAQRVFNSSSSWPPCHFTSAMPCAAAATVASRPRPQAMRTAGCRPRRLRYRHESRISRPCTATNAVSIPIHHMTACIRINTHPVSHCGPV